MSRNDLTLIFGLIFIFVVLPVIGMIVDDWHTQNCKIELVKNRVPIDEIEKVCK